MNELKTLYYCMNSEYTEYGWLLQLNKKRLVFLWVTNNSGSADVHHFVQMYSLCGEWVNVSEFSLLWEISDKKTMFHLGIIVLYFYMKRVCIYFCVFLVPMDLVAGSHTL